jgi:hypothetical protein
MVSLIFLHIVTRFPRSSFEKKKRNHVNIIQPVESVLMTAREREKTMEQHRAFLTL